MNNRRKQERGSERIWTRVMREGASVEEAATEFGLSTQRLERLLIAVGKRRVARQMRGDGAATAAG
jgi:transposase